MKKPYDPWEEREQVRRKLSDAGLYSYQDATPSFSHAPQREDYRTGSTGDEDYFEDEMKYMLEVLLTQRK